MPIYRGSASLFLGARRYRSGPTIGHGESPGRRRAIEPALGLAHAGSVTFKKSWDGENLIKMVCVLGCCNVVLIG